MYRDDRKIQDMTPEDRAKMRPQGSPGGGAGRPPSAERGKEEAPSVDERKRRIGRFRRHRNADRKSRKSEERATRKIFPDERKNGENRRISEVPGCRYDRSGKQYQYISRKKQQTCSVRMIHISRLLKDSRDRNSGEITDAAREAREKIRELSDDLREFFRNTLLAGLRSQIDQLVK